MVATLKDESKDVKLRLPATRENWLQIEQQIRSAATELEIMPLLDGVYVVKPLFPKIPITKYRYEMVNAPASPGGTVPRTPGGGNRLQIPQLDANGQKMFSTELIDPTGDPAGPRRRIVAAQYEVETGESDFSTSELVKLYQQKERNDKEKDCLIAKSWSFLMTITEDHLRDLIMPYEHLIDRLQKINIAWRAINFYYEGDTQEDRRVQLDLLMQGIPRTFNVLEREPTVEEVSQIASAILAVVGTFAKLVPAINIEDYQKKSLFIKSLPFVCDDKIQQ